MSKIYKKNIAVFLIALIATMPFYVSSVFAQGNVQDPTASCLEKKQDSDDLVETLDSGPIKALETVAATLHFTCTAWATVDVAKNVYRSVVTGTVDVPKSLPPAPQATTAEMITDTPVATFMNTMCSIVECKENFIADILPDSIGDPIGDLQSKIRGDGDSLGVGIGPFDNIYSSIAYLCPVGILFNLRKLKTIYQTNSCCIEQACANGLNTESCDRQLSEATCMYWEGSILQSLVGILIHFLSIFFAKALEDAVQDIIKDYSLGWFIGVIKALYGAYNHIQALQSTFKWMSETFSEPNCEDLNFGQIRDQARQASKINCELVQVDINGDGIIDRLEQRCA